MRHEETMALRGSLLQYIASATVDKVELASTGYCVHPIADTKLPIDLAGVKFHSADGQNQLVRDLTVCQPVTEELEHFQFAGVSGSMSDSVDGGTGSPGPISEGSPGSVVGGIDN
jgi:hypothetical protein